MEPSWLFHIPSPSVFACYSKVALHGSMDDQDHVWQVAVSQFLVFVHMVFVAVACDGITLSKMQIRLTFFRLVAC